MLPELTAADLEVPNLGLPKASSPLAVTRAGRHPARFVRDCKRIRADIHVWPEGEEGLDLTFERAGPRERIYFDPGRTRVAVVTCGGLCPGLNDVIRALVMELYYGYGVRDILGIRYGYSGLATDAACPPMPLTPEVVEDIHQEGGTILGTSRGHPAVPDLVDRLEELGIQILYTCGGDGTLRGAGEIHREIARRGLEIAVVGIPKTIDNDIPLVYRSFGFESAVQQATAILSSAHYEARGVLGGVGLVKLMGRHAGFIAAYAACASGDVNYCLVPEIPFALRGEGGFLEHLRDRLRRRRHAVVVVAEGAGQHLIGDTGERDASGNLKFNDVGLFLQREIAGAFAGWGETVNIKYFDPSYAIRGIRANSGDSIFCSNLARNAVHAGMAGKTGILIGFWHGVFTHVPLGAIQGRTKQIHPRQNLWLSVLANTGQPANW